MSLLVAVCLVMALTSALTPGEAALTPWKAGRLEGQGQVQDACVPGVTCRLPACRCWDDPDIPGRLAAKATPQTVLVSFQYAVNQRTISPYMDMISDLRNPNNCSATATFFVQGTDTDFGAVKMLHDKGQEVGVTSLDGTTPTDSQAWQDSYGAVKQKIVSALVPGPAVRGSRAPEMAGGGDAMMAAVDGLGLMYDASCVSSVYAYTENMLWPYTYDWTYNTPQCRTGATPQEPHKGKWQFLAPTMRWAGQSCDLLSDCAPFISSSQAAYDFIYQAFSAHYNGTRSPFLLYLDPLWLRDPGHVDGTRRFLKMAAAMADTWLVGHAQALSWVTSPVPISRAKDFLPWGC